MTAEEFPPLFLLFLTYVVFLIYRNKIKGSDLNEEDISFTGAYVVTFFMCLRAK
jgi:hypothetical protein